MADVWLGGGENREGDRSRVFAEQRGADLVGIYRHNESGDIPRVTADEEGLALGFEAKERLRWVGADTLEPIGDPLRRLTFEAVAGAATRLLMDAVGGPVRVYGRLDQAGVQATELSAAGAYWSDELDARYTVSVVDDRLVLRWPRYPAVSLHPAGCDTVAHDEVRLKLLRGTNGTVDGIEVASERARGLVFRRSDH